MDLSPRAGVTTAYSKVGLRIDRRLEQPVAIEYFEGDRLVRTQHREQFQTIEGRLLPSLFRFVSHDRDAELSMTLSGWRVNVGVPDSVFTQRTLFKGL